LHLVRPVTEDDDNVLDAGFPEVGDARLDDGLFAERKQRFEGAHPL
jgi:hypothetical protein